MNSHRQTTAAEHYATFFDHRFLLQGLALYESLQRHHPGSWLWVLCLDREVERQLERLQLPRLRPLSLRELETPELRDAKRNRSRVDYIFTLTPFVYDFVFREDAAIDRLTYVDADVYFFRSPVPLLAEMEAADRSIQLTEHGFSPEFRHLAEEFGRFCVQFLSMRRDEASARVLRRWREQCLETCTTAVNQRSQFFGDQKYLNDWPEQYPDFIHICRAQAEMLGPWNVDYYQALSDKPYLPVFYHFHSFRIFSRNWVQLSTGFNPRSAFHLYKEYFHALHRQDRRLKDHGIPRPHVPFANDRIWLPRLLWRWLTGRANVRRFNAWREPAASTAPKPGGGFRPAHGEASALLKNETAAGESRAAGV
ncbi:MAG TPA: hypothetical protein VFB27_00320 [Opitutaceae bacterium]|nr:hypothetical protein [Opitutaceae bacterium]